MENIDFQTVDYQFGVKLHDSIYELKKKITINEKGLQVEAKEIRFNGEVVDEITFQHIANIKSLVVVIVVTAGECFPTEYYCGAKEVSRFTNARFNRGGLVRALNEKWEGCNADAEALGYGLEDLDAYPQ